MDLSAYSVDGLTPRRVERPRDAQGVADVITGANRDGAAVLLLGGGTRIGVGETPSRYDVALDLRDVAGVVEHSPADLVCSVRAGTTLAELASALAPKRQRWPVEVAEPDRATVGGTIASAAASPSRLRHQHVRDWVIGCEAVLGDGTHARAGGRVVKNVTGYDLTRLYSGSFGTLAALVEVNLKLVAVDEATLVLALHDADVPRLSALAAEIRVALPLDSIVLATSADGGSLSVRVAGSAAAVARLSADLRARAPFAEVDPSAWQALVDGTTTASDVARVATAPGNEAEALSGDAIAYIGTGCAYLLGARGDDELRATRARCESRGGALVLERIAPERKSALGAWGTIRTPSAIQMGLKRRFDPKSVLAPGRIAA